MNPSDPAWNCPEDDLDLWRGWPIDDIDRWHGVALLDDGSLSGWGNNSNMQIDIPAALARPTPQSPPVEQRVTAVEATCCHNVAFLADGSVCCWGDKGQCDSLDLLLHGKKATAVAVGAEYRMALLSDGTLLRWGDNRRDGVFCMTGRFP